MDNKDLVQLRFYNMKDISTIMGISETSAHRIIKRLNNELEEQGFIVVAGKIGREYFDARVPR